MFSVRLHIPYITIYSYVMDYEPEKPASYLVFVSPPYAVATFSGAPMSRCEVLPRLVLVKPLIIIASGRPL